MLLNFKKNKVVIFLKLLNVLFISCFFDIVYIFDIIAIIKNTQFI